ncbi:MAG TPA: ABC transporter ATP-binding protein [Alphaproteobacteria bacterium]|nr:ABC transporter ATP-binding protein [Alphaproteobacteria bacterium]
MSNVILKTQQLTRIYHQAGESLTILHNVDLEIKSGEIVALVGPSGSGKSTFLQTVGLLDKATSGDLIINDQSVANMNDKERTMMRRKFIGFVYQFHYLLPEFTALENVVIPQMVAGVKRKEAEEKAKSLLTSLKMDHRFDHRPARLSGGEQQRVAIARALANDPKLLLADEPTGNLDPETSETVFELLIDLVRECGIGAVIATHNMQIAERMDRILELKGGKIISY